MTPSPPSSGSAPLRDRGALVTGGSRGIGRAIVTRLAAAGAAVVFTYRTSAAAAEALVDEIREQGGRAHAVARGTLLTLQFAARNLRDNGRIITISTIGTHWPSPGEAAYAASKAAAEQLTRVASRELGSRGITANVLALGPTDTDLLRSTAPPAALDATAAMPALGRIGGPADIAGLVALLAHQDSGWITGQIIRADGGLT
ncbi:SDR family oxidoreductase [Nocardia cyriacigeorgica]|uniref:SDR family oxidoreductase n=1 Tax=Nocardia cyriacigeorgica TaxID=135487 RepID=UPI0013D0CBAC|nr:SDR family oxidoreductase [Nocardia cyriacigeorgica]NEW26816.1 SDR family oxidoreductase [Nocardia cyriacigeorgica]